MLAQMLTSRSISLDAVSNDVTNLTSVSPFRGARSGASSENGLLHIDLVREVPEAQKPRTITINKGGRTIEAVKATTAQAA